MSLTISRYTGTWFAIALAAASGTTVQAQARYTDPGEIDRAVERFTGAAIGNVGGARLATDPRLRLAPCTGPLATTWHGAPGRTVRVVCEDPGGWRIFVAIQPAADQTRTSPIITRGDQLTVAVRGRGFTIQKPGEATEAGAQGDWIAVRLSHGQKTLSARVERPGLAVIGMD